MAMETWPAFNQRPAGRADLVRALIALGEDSLERSARLLGYEEDQAEEEWPEKIKPRFISIPQEDLPDIDHRREPALDKAPVVPKPIGRFYRMTRYRAISSEERQRAKTAYQQARALGASELEANPDIVPMKVPPLAPWKRLWPFLHWVLGAQWEGRRLDVASAVVQLSQGRVLKRIPYLSVQSWAITCQIIVEICPRTDLFRDDFAELCTKVMQMRGRSGLDIVVLREGPAALCRPDVFQEQAYRIPDPATPVLILSDLGHYDSSGIESRTWCRFVRGLKKKGLHPVALTPTPPRLWNVALANLIPLVSWDRARKLPTVLQRPSLAKNADTFGSSEKLLNLLAPAVRVEPPLLRAARYLLPVQEADVAEEAAAWLHTDVSATVNGFAYLPEKKQKFRNSFKLQKKELKTAVCHAIDIYHRHLAPDVRTEEALNCDELAGIHCKEAIERSWRVARTLAGQRDAPAGMAPWFDRLTQRQSKDMWRRYPALEVAWYCRHQDALETGESIAKPNGLNVARAASIALQQSGPTRYGLYQTGQFLEVRELGHTNVKLSQNGFEKLSSPLAEIESTTPYLYWQLRDLGDGTESSEILDMRREIQAPLLMIRDGRLTIFSDRAEIVLHDRQTAGVYIKCMVTFGNGVMTGMGDIKRGRLLTPRDQRLAVAACCVAAAGATTAGVRAPLGATAARPSAGVTASVSVLPEVQKSRSGGKGVSEPCRTDGAERSRSGSARCCPTAGCNTPPTWRRSVRRPTATACNRAGNGDRTEISDYAMHTLCYNHSVFA
jgi:hypothetical protein